MNLYSKTHRGILAAFITAALIVSATSGSAADNGNVVVSGTVDAVNEITVSTEAGATISSADLLAGVIDQTVSAVNEKNNNTAGYTVTLESTNAAATAQAKLVGSGNAANVINYSIKYDGVAVTLLSGSATVTDVTAPTAEAGVDKNIQVTTTAGWHNADTYSDTLTLTIASK